ncbi:hypothetical protein [Cytophaga aurantiaca]|uniref:hypothetical protein n=1 Tax=Cytophaga aurantiaca TaxID=29530 RepID=UPI00035CB2BD|nr:hypothetical protein [Cytophaga aurantiaca]
MIDNGTAKIEKTIDGIRISIPSKKNWFALIFGTAWLGGWYAGFTSAYPTVMYGFEQGEMNGFMTFWLIGWTIGGVGIISVLSWGYFGKEKFNLRKGEVLFEESIFGIGRKRRLQATAVKNIRTELNNDSWFGSNRWAFWGLGPGKIKFDYGLKTFSFALGVDDAEANHIVALLKEQFQN